MLLIGIPGIQLRICFSVLLINYMGYGMRKYTTNTNMLSSGPALLTNLSIGTKQTSGYIKCTLGFLIQTEFGFRFLILFRLCIGYIGGNIWALHFLGRQGTKCFLKQILFTTTHAPSTK